MNGLQVAGSGAVPALLALLQEPTAAIEVVAGAADAIGECATAPEMGPAVAALRVAMERLDGIVQRKADGGWPTRQVAASPRGGRYTVAPEVGLVAMHGRDG